MGDMNLIEDAIEQAKAPPAEIDEVPTDPNAVIGKAIERAGTDCGAPFESDVVEALAIVRQESHAQYLRYRQAFKKANSGVLVGELDKLVKSRCGDTGDEAESTADILVNLVQTRTELFTDMDKRPYARFEQNGHHEVWSLDSPGLREWLSYAFYQEYGKAPRDASIKDALSTLAGLSVHEGDQHEVYLRCAPNPAGEGYIIDLCDEAWRVIEVTPTGWRVLDKSPVRFRRTPTMKPLPVPETGGKLSDLWEFANVEPQDRGLVIAWLLESLRPETPFPVLEIGGEQGSAKSSTQSRLRDFIDPSSINLRAAPKTDEDVFVSADSNWLASYNNLSHLSPSRQDAFCTLSTGGGYGGRKLYTNSEEAVWDSKRPVVINGISTLVTAPDLLDRTIRIESPKIETYISESDLQASFDDKRAGIFGALLDLFVEALALLPGIKIDRPPRMTDFAYFGEAIYQATGKEPGMFLADYQKGREAAVLQSIESSPVASAVIDMARKTEFSGTVGELLNRLDRDRPRGDTGWPRSAKGLSDVLRRYAPALRILGVSVEFEARGNRGRTVHIYLHRGGVERGDLNVTTVTTVTQPAKSDVGDDEIRRFDTPPSNIYTAGGTPPDDDSEVF